ncbi:MAG: RNA polymerase sigma factor [Bacteroidota bacterium]
MSKRGPDIEEAFLEKVNANRRIIHKVCNLYLKDEAEKEDLFQEILLQLWRAYPNFQGKAKFSTWMYRIALNTAITGVRKSQRKVPVEDREVEEADVIGEDTLLDKKERSQVLWKAIYSLSDVEKAIIILYMESYSYEEISEMVGINVNHLGVKINRIKKKLKAILSPHLT